MQSVAYQGFWGTYATLPYTSTLPSVLLIAPVIADNKLLCRVKQDGYVSQFQGETNEMPTFPAPT